MNGRLGWAKVNGVSAHVCIYLAKSNPLPRAHVAHNYTVIISVVINIGSFFFFKYISSIIFFSVSFSPLQFQRPMINQKWTSRISHAAVRPTMIYGRPCRERPPPPSFVMDSASRPKNTNQRKDSPNTESLSGRLRFFFRI